MTATSVPAPTSWRRSLRGRETLAFYAFIAPWVLGFLLFIAGPLLASLALGFTRYDVILPAKWVGLQHFRDLFADPLFWTSLGNTTYIVLVAVPLGMVIAFAVALLLNQKVQGMAAYRTGYFMPSIVPAVASAALWLYLLQPQWGLVNGTLELFGLKGPGWLASTTWSKPSIIMLMVWASGGTMIIYLAGLQDIPASLYEAASIDGANAWGRLRHVTLPLMTPTVFFTLVMGIIGTFQIFAVVFVLTDGMGGPLNSTLVYLVYVYRNAFVFFRMGYASAMSLILFLIILALTWLNFRFAGRWVHTEADFS